MPIHGRGTLRYCGIKLELARFKQATDKRRYNVLSICPVAHPYTLAGFGVFDAAKLQLFPDIERKKILPAKKPAGMGVKK